MGYKNANSFLLLHNVDIDDFRDVVRTSFSKGLAGSTESNTQFKVKNAKIQFVFIRHPKYLLFTLAPYVYTCKSLIKISNCWIKFI